MGDVTAFSIDAERDNGIWLTIGDVVRSASVEARTFAKDLPGAVIGLGTVVRLGQECSSSRLSVDVAVVDVMYFTLFKKMLPSAVGMPAQDR